MRPGFSPRKRKPNKKEEKTPMNERRPKVSVFTFGIL
jgi:hypothetical protein